MARIVVLSVAVVIRIDTFREGSLLVMHVAGSLAGSDVAVLGETVAVEGLPHRVELSGVEFVDAEGASALLGLEARGTSLVGAEPYVDLLLRAKPGSVPE
jgi:anti-anti-sigma regulatory factor